MEHVEQNQETEKIDENDKICESGETGQSGDTQSGEADKAQESKPAATRSRAEGVSASWTDPDVAAKRKQRNSVMVGGIQYRSVCEAFEKLDLPLNKHIKFRAELKAEGTKTFTTDVGTEYVFSLAPAIEAAPKVKAEKAAKEPKPAKAEKAVKEPKPAKAAKGKKAEAQQAAA